MPYEKIVVTGCSHSTGCEMNDHLLGTFKDDKQRQFEILKWYKNNFSLGKINFKDLHDTANKKWQNQCWEYHSHSFSDLGSLFFRPSS